MLIIDAFLGKGREREREGERERKRERERERERDGGKERAVDGRFLKRIWKGG